MLSAQCDELRKAALGARAMGQFETFVLMRDAADTIISLRDRAQDLQSENAKLRAERDYLLANSNPTAAELRRVRSAWKKDRDENERLRELVRMQDECIASNCEWCKHRKNCESLDVECELDDLARELGIEVEE